MIGIYKIISPSGKAYIGQSWNIEERKRNYNSLHCKGQTKLYYSIQKYGWSNHKFETLHVLPEDVSQIILDQYEQLYMDHYREVGIELLNLREAGSHGLLSVESRIKMSLKRLGNKNTLGRQLSEDHKNKIRNSLKGRIFSKEHKEKLKLNNAKTRPVFQYTKKGEIIKEWESVSEASNYLGISSSLISRTATGKLKTSRGFIWKYKDIEYI